MLRACPYAFFKQLLNLVGTNQLALRSFIITLVVSTNPFNCLMKVHKTTFEHFGWITAVFRCLNTVFFWTMPGPLTDFPVNR